MHMLSLLRRRLVHVGLPLLVGAFLLAGCGGSGGDAAGESGVPYSVGEPVADTTVALIVSSTYGTDTLAAQQYEGQLQRRLQRLPPQQRSPDTLQSIHRELVRSVAGQHVLRGQAEAEGISVDTAQVSSQLSRIRQRYQSEEQFRKQLAQNNLTVDSLRQLLANQLRAQQLRQQMAETAESPSAQEVEAYSKENRRISAQHILLRAGEDAPQSKVDSARQAAQALLDSAQAGADFAALARRHSEGPSAEEGGDLGFFSRDQMVEPFAEAAFALADSGDIAPEPVRTRFGFHVIRLTDAGQPMDTTKARKQMMQERQREALNRELDALLEKATVRVNPDIVEAGLNE